MTGPILSVRDQTLGLEAAGNTACGGDQVRSRVRSELLELAVRVCEQGACVRVYVRVLAPRSLIGWLRCPGAFSAPGSVSDCPGHRLESLCFTGASLAIHTDPA